MAIVPRKTGNGYIFFRQKEKNGQNLPGLPTLWPKKNEKWAENYEQIVNK